MQLFPPLMLNFNGNVSIFPGCSPSFGNTKETPSAFEESRWIESIWVCVANGISPANYELPFQSVKGHIFLTQPLEWLAFSQICLHFMSCHHYNPFSLQNRYLSTTVKITFEIWICFLSFWIELRKFHHQTLGSIFNHIKNAFEK